MSTVSFIQGMYTVQVARLNSSGIAMGQAANPNSVANGTLLAPYRVTHPVSVGGLTPTRELATDRGGQRIRGQKDLGASDFGTIEMVLSDYDMGFDAVVSGSTVDTSYVSGLTQGAGNHTQPDLPQVVAMFTVGSQSRDASNYGADEFKSFIVVGTIAGSQPSSSQNGGTNPNPLSYTMTPTIVSKVFNGIPFSALDVNYYNNENVVHNMGSTDQLAFVTYVADTSDTTFTLPFLPLYDDADGSTNNWITENSENAAASSVNTSTGVVTIASATAGDTWVVIYPTAFATA